MSDLADAARGAQAHAYAPYSNYPVGAAIRGSDGRIWTGCNVENISFPLSACAERNAVAAMLRDGVREIREVALVTQDGGTPCGGCRQVLLEFSPDPAQTRIHCYSASGMESSYTLAELVPHAFRSGDVNRTER
jgi:cytidine deaminase